MNRNDLPYPWGKEETKMLEDFRQQLRTRIKQHDVIKPVWQFSSRQNAEAIVQFVKENWGFVAAAGYTLTISRPDFTWDVTLETLPPLPMPAHSNLC